MNCRRRLFHLRPMVTSSLVQRVTNDFVPALFAVAVGGEMVHPAFTQIDFVPVPFRFALDILSDTFFSRIPAFTRTRATHFLGTTYALPALGHSREILVVIDVGDQSEKDCVPIADRIVVGVKVCARC